MANNILKDLSKSGGYDVQFVKEEVSNLDLKCSICLFVLREPVQAVPCGHRFCRSCIELEKERQEPEKLSCPIDRDEITIFPDKGKQREILGFEVKCQNKGPANCSWIGDLKNFEEHNKQCPFQFIVCDKGCGQKEILRRDMARHLENDCPKNLLPCAFASVGCQFKGRKKELGKHLNTSTSQHMMLQIEDVNKRLSTLEEDLKTEKEDNKKLKAKIKRLKDDFETKNESLKSKIRKIESTPTRKCPYTFIVKDASSKLNSGKNISSEVFEHFGGYNAQLEVEFNEDGSLGLFCIVIEGPFDNVLQWPMIYDNISMKCFINGKTVKDNSFVLVDGAKVTFNKPTKEKHSSWGWKSYLSKEDIPAYLENDEIKFVVDITREE